MPLQFRPLPEKIVELMLYLAHARPGADKYLAVKLFYLADREHLLRYGRPITQENYVAMDYGPVASTVLDLFNGNDLTKRRLGIKDLPFTFTEKERPGKPPVAALGAPAREVDFDVFSKSDLRIFDEIIEKYGNMSFEELYRETHNHFAYKRAWEERGGLRASAMRYEEMIESAEDREKLVADLEMVAAHF